MSSPSDYYSVLRRVTAALDPAAEAARQSIYDRARQALMEAGLPGSQMEAERSALEGAIERIESEMQAAAPATRGPGGPRPRRAERAVPEKPQEPGPQARRRSLRVLAALGASAVLLVAFVAYLVWPHGTDRAGRGTRARAPVAGSEKGKPADAAREAGRSYIFNRQMVYYRTVHPVGTIVIARSQGFLHLVRPNVAAMRYTVGIGRACASVAGLLTVSAKEDWSQSPAQTAAIEPPPGQAARDARSRFGLRALALGDHGHRIHGTYAPSTAGDGGCFVLINDDIADLYDRVAVGTRVVIN
jgi:lipoprotein-anchoring transpeptidase ErfK/SrfK